MYKRMSAKSKCITDRRLLGEKLYFIGLTESHLGVVQVSGRNGLILVNYPNMLEYWDDNERYDEKQGWIPNDDRNIVAKEGTKFTVVESDGDTYKFIVMQKDKTYFKLFLQDSANRYIDENVKELTLGQCINLTRHKYNLKTIKLGW